MSFFDVFKKKQNEANNKNRVPQQPSYNLEAKILPNGNYAYNFVDYENDPNKDYDTTYLEVNPRYKILAGRPVYEAKVSWYREDDTQLNNPQTGKMEYLRKDDTSKILIEANLNSLTNDPKYIQLFMRNLLSEKRVEGYLERGLEENPNGYKCGNYIGGVEYSSKTGELQKIFHTSVGEAVHNSPEMVQARADKVNRKRNELLNNLRSYEIQKEQNVKKINEAEEQLKKFDEQHGFRQSDKDDDSGR